MYEDALSIVNASLFGISGVANLGGNSFIDGACIADAKESVEPVVRCGMPSLRLWLDWLSLLGAVYEVIAADVR